MVGMRFSLLLSVLALSASAADTAVPYPGPPPGSPEIMRAEDGTPIGLKNACIAWETDPCFTLTTTEDAYSFADDFVSSVTETGEAAQTEGTRASAFLPGKTLTATFSSEKAGITITWQAELREGSHYVRETYTLTAERAVELTGFTPIVLEDNGFSIPGEVPGTPLVQEKEHGFYAVELPVAQAEVKDGLARMGIACRLPLAAGQKVSFSAVAGVFPEGQLRRAFLAYLERERAAPYHTFLQYNCRYDHGRNPTEKKLLDTIADYRTELVQKRGVLPDSFAADEGWSDDSNDLLQPHPQQFPNGFTPVSDTLRAMGSHLGVRISPPASGSAAHEYARFAARCRELSEKDGTAFFKWDMAGDALSPHFMALADTARELRAANPALFLSAAGETWPSPFWLFFADCIGRAGSADVAWAGEGSNRARAITYRDAACYRLIVRRAPLFPLNSLMHHGLVLGREFQARYTSDMRRGGDESSSAAEPGADGSRPINFPVNNDLRADAHLLFASGANLQELCLTPEMMDSRAWDDVAESLRLSHRRADIAADTHWVGGDPAQGEVYGYAAWREDRGATLALRNPAATRRSISLRQSDFEPVLPRTVHLRAAYGDQRVQQLELRPDTPLSLEMEPFEVLVFEADFSPSAENLKTE